MVGRREVYLTAYLCFTLVFILLADAPNIGAALAARTLSGLFGCVGTILVGGTLADICACRLSLFRRPLEVGKVVGSAQLCRRAAPPIVPLELRKYT